MIEAKVKKGARIEEENRVAASRKNYEMMMLPFKAETLVNFCKGFYQERFGKDYVIDGKNSSILKMLSNYFTNTESAGIDLNKGILIMGNVGVGKTELMRFLQKNKKCCFKIVSCNDVSDDYMTLKEGTDEAYSTPIKKALNDPSVFYQRSIGYCFDDLGTEDIKNDFGNKKNVMADIIMAIYNKKDFSKFHITTNLDADGIKEKYGSRVSSRLREMFNVIHFDGLDRRK